MANPSPSASNRGKRGRRPTKTAAAPAPLARPSAGPVPTAPGSQWCTLRVYAEADGPVAALVLVTHQRRGTEVWEMDLPYVLWQSMGTRAAAALVARFYRMRYPATVRQLGLRLVRSTIAAYLQLHTRECPHCF
ncbi:hypothetical protein [Hymenobacter sp. CRA2]|uniref:hypothetical protein n=1 Tax=Hymenobacter sp. CRA2 TaxID=1955620 RepID=UPI00098EE45E|nr:hypothetical protein [Hymenobacter sp. CRA2]OON66456.1 hypothetical protein B0919_21720 [Hymenobacter sp. CRA2]